MKKLLFGLIATFMLSVTSNAQTFYLKGTGTLVGKNINNNFVLNKEIVGKSLFNDKIEVKIDKTEILNTLIESEKYIVVYGTSIENDPDGKTSKGIYKIAFGISTSSKLYVSDTHTCKSYDSFLYGCSCCKFIKSRSGAITGCDCCEFGWCNHEVSNGLTLNDSLSKILN